MATPRLMEPVYYTEIQTPVDCVSATRPPPVASFNRENHYNNQVFEQGRRCIIPVVPTFRRSLILSFSRSVVPAFRHPKKLKKKSLKLKNSFKN
jgi:hypothetical protein